jgi:hypothetical protein
MKWLNNLEAGFAAKQAGYFSYPVQIIFSILKKPLVMEN